MQNWEEDLKKRQEEEKLRKEYGVSVLLKYKSFLLFLYRRQTDTHMFYLFNYMKNKHSTKQN